MTFILYAILTILILTFGLWLIAIILGITFEILENWLTFVLIIFSTIIGVIGSTFILITLSNIVFFIMGKPQNWIFF